MTIVMLSNKNGKTKQVVATLGYEPPHPLRLGTGLPTLATDDS